MAVNMGGIAEEVFRPMLGRRTFLFFKVRARQELYFIFHGG